ncbi:MAG: molybdenum cofactor guanylyltransferase [Planctomycetia bacterium]
MAPLPPRTAVVLAGGASARMGRDKASLPLGRGTLLGHVLEALAPLAGDLSVVARPGQVLPPLPPAVRVLHDRRPGEGPLAGLVEGLRAARHDVVLVSACDTPLLVPAVLELLLARLGSAPAAVALAGGLLQPMACVLRREVLGTAERLLAEGRRRPLDLLEAVAAVPVPEADLRAVDPQLRHLHNVNTPADLEAARAWLEGAGSTPSGI